jgi:hypothetical protein
MYLLACRIEIKIKLFFSTVNHKIIYLTIIKICRKNLNQSDCMDCKIITIEGEEKAFWWDVQIVINVLKSNRNY